MIWEKHVKHRLLHIYGCFCNIFCMNLVDMPYPSQKDSSGKVGVSMIIIRIQVSHCLYQTIGRHDKNTDV